MPGEATRTVAVCGATGRQGGAVARGLIAQGWNVHALTRKPRGRAARALADLGAEVGRELTLAADLRSLGDCRSLYRELIGRKPRSVPMPTWLFDRFTRKDPTAMWRWLRTQRVEVDPAATRAILPTALTVREWLSAIRDRRRSRPEQEGD